MTYTIQNEVFTEDELEETSTDNLRLLLAECRSHKAHVELEIKEAQFEYKNRRGPGFTAIEHAERELEIARLKDFEYKLDLLILQRE